MVKTWHTMKDERVRPQRVYKTKSGWKQGKSKGKYDYQKMEGVQVPINEEFTLPSGAKTQAPGKSGVAGEDINCRCFLSYDVVENTIASSEINTRNSARGHASAVEIVGAEINLRQKAILDELPEYNSRQHFSKNAVNMTDLAALTAATGDEFAMFTRGSERLLVRGNTQSVKITVDEAKELAQNGYRWSGHTHPGTSRECLTASHGDYLILAAFGQKRSVVYNSLGQFDTFGEEE